MSFSDQPEISNIFAMKGKKSTSIYSKTSVVYQKHTQTETRRIVTDKKLDIKQKFTLTHQHTNTHYLAISTSVRCFIVAINTIENCKKKSQHSCSYASQTIIYRMLRNCPKSFIIVTHKHTTWMLNFTKFSHFITTLTKKIDYLSWTNKTKSQNKSIF